MMIKGHYYCNKQKQVWSVARRRVVVKELLCLVDHDKRAINGHINGECMCYVWMYSMINNP